MSFRPGQAVNFEKDGETYAGVIRGAPQYDLGLYALETRLARLFDQDDYQDAAAAYEAGTRFTARVDSPKLPGTLFGLDISAHMTTAMIGDESRGMRWAWDQPIMRTFVESCALVYPVRGQYRRDEPTVAQLDAEGPEAGEWYHVASSAITTRRRGEPPAEPSGFATPQSEEAGL